MASQKDLRKSSSLRQAKEKEHFSQEDNMADLKGKEENKPNQDRIPDEKWTKDREKETKEDTKLKPFKQGDKSDLPEDPAQAKEFRDADSDKRGVAKLEDAASGAEMVPEDAITDPGVNPWKLREGNEFLKKDLGFSMGKCVGNSAVAGRLKALRDKGKFTPDVDKELEAIENELTASAQ